MFKLIWKIKLLDGEMGREVGRAAVHGVDIENDNIFLMSKLSL